MNVQENYFFEMSYFGNLLPMLSTQSFVLYGQATKRIRWMPWQSEAMKDVVACEKLRGVGKQTLIRRCLNGGTQPS